MAKATLLPMLCHGLMAVAVMARCTTAATSTTTLNVPKTKPTGTFRAPGDFVGFGFEMAFLNDYANDFSNNLLNSVANRVSEKLTVRSGGTSGDKLTFNPNQKEIRVCVAGDCPIGSDASYILGPSYFNGFSSFQNQMMSVQAPLSPSPNISNSVNYVKRAKEKLGDRLTAIAIGNEPDLYPGQFKVTYTVADYIKGIKAVRAALVDQLKLSGRIFELMDVAFLAEQADKTKITIKNAFSQGLNEAKNAKFAAAHYYQLWDDITSLPDMQRLLMNHTALTAKFSQGVPQDVAYLAANFPNVKYIFSESGSALKGSLRIQAGLGAALWAVDFQLHALARGVARVDSTHRPAAAHSLWVPNDSAPNNPGPQVRGPFYAQAFVADFIGKTPGDVKSLDLKSDVLTGYASYGTGSAAKLQKLALVNMRAWAKGVSTGARGGVMFAVPVPAGSSVTVKRLRADVGCQAMGFDNAGPAENITWAGEQWAYKIDQGKGHRVASVPVSEEVPVKDGVAQINVPDSEAVIAYFS